MNNRTGQIDLIKLALYILKRCWLVILCAAIGCGYMYWSATHNRHDTYTASGTMYVYNSNPNIEQKRIPVKTNMISAYPRAFFVYSERTKVVHIFSANIRQAT